MRQPALVTISAAVLALALAGCGHKADTTSSDAGTVVADNGTALALDANMGAPATSQGQTFANTAAASDAFEIASSQLASTNAQSAAVKSFAAKMIDAHTDSTAKLKAAAANASPPLTPDPTLTSDQQQKLGELKGLTGAAFDKAYAAAQVEGQQATLDALKGYSANGDVPQLKAFATELVPVVAAHLNMAKGLKR